MLELILLSPLLVVFIGACIAGFSGRRRWFGVLGWGVVIALSTGAFFLPLSVGVWIPDLIGTTHTLSSVTTSSGYSLRVTQAWNYVDFYSTTLYVTAPDGSTTDTVLDGDDTKSWSVPVALDEPGRTATVMLGGGRSRVIHW